MTHHSVVIALAFGFFAYSSSLLQVAAAEPQCVWTEDSCPKGMHELKRSYQNKGLLGGVIQKRYCCTQGNTVTEPTTPSKPYATGESEAERQQRFAKECAAQNKLWQGGQCINRPVKNIAKEKPVERPAAIMKADCEAKGLPYDSAKNQCGRPVKSIAKGSTGTGENAAIIAGCEKQGGVWDSQMRRCIKPTSKETSAEGEDDSKPKKKKQKKGHYEDKGAYGKKKQHDDDDD